MFRCAYFVLCRYSDDTIRAVEMLDSEEKIDLDLIVSLIRHIVLNEEVSLSARLPLGPFPGNCVIQLLFGEIIDGNALKYLLTVKLPTLRLN